MAGGRRSDKEISMRAYQVTDHDQPAALADLPRPSPGPGEVLVRIRACGLHPIFSS